MNCRNPFAIFLLAFGLLVSCNPFAPEYDENGLADINLLGDPSQIEGFFQLFKNGYELRDTTIYGRLFAPDFIFSYYDFDLGQEINWDRETELNISYNLFQSVQMITLDWNYYTLDTTLTEAFVVRNFNLTIDENEQTSFSGSGRARLRLRREKPGDPWKAYSWFDDSDF